MANVAELVAEIKMKGAKEAAEAVKELQKHLRQTGKEAQKAGEQAEEFNKTLESDANKAAAAANVLRFSLASVLKVAAAGVPFLVAGVRKSNALAIEMDKLGFKTKIGAEAFQQLDNAFRQHGSNVDHLISAYEHLQERRSLWKKRTGWTQEEAKAFGDLQLNPNDYNTTWDLLDAIAKKANNLGDKGLGLKVAKDLGVDSEVLRIWSKGSYFTKQNTVGKDLLDEANEVRREYSVVIGDIGTGLTELGALFMTGPGKIILDWMRDFNKLLQDVQVNSTSFGAVLDNLGTNSDGSRNHFGILLDMLYSDEREQLERARRNSTGKYGFKNALQGNTQKTIFRELTMGGLNPIAIAGIMGNIENESGFDPQRKIIDNNGKISAGLIQWNGERFEELKAFAKSKTGTEAAWVRQDIQMQFLLYELRNKKRFAGVMDRLNASQTPEEAAVIFAREVEKPLETEEFKKYGKGKDKAHIGKRKLDARKFYHSIVPAVNEDILKDASVETDAFSDLEQNAVIEGGNKNITYNFTSDTKVYAENADGKSIEEIKTADIQNMFKRTAALEA